MSATAIFNCDLFTPGEHIPQGLVLIEEKTIRAVGVSHEIPLSADTRLLDAQGGRLTPGLIDLGGVPSNNDLRETRGITSSLMRVAVQDERDLQVIRQAAASLPSPAGSARALGLHLESTQPFGNAGALHWQDLWLASDATIKLATLDAATDVSDPAAMQDAGIRLVLTTTACADPGIEIDDVRIGRWGIPEDVTMDPACYHLMTIDHVRSASRSVLQTLVASHHLILVGSETLPLSTRSIRGLMALADTDFVTALTATTLAPAHFLDLPLGHLVVDSPADLICWTRHGDLAWTMVGGEIVYPKQR